MSAQVQQLLERDPGRPVWLVVGKEPVLVERTVDAIRAAVLPLCGPPSFNVAVARLSDGRGAQALSAARTLPMMADRRLVLVQELEEGDDAFFTALVDYLAEPSPSTTLVLAGAGFPKVVKGGRSWSKKVTDLADARGAVIKFGDRDVEPVAFVREHAASLGHALAAQDARLLVELVGGDLGRLAREVEKAALFVEEGRPIDGDAVRAACSLLAEAPIWDLTAGIVGRDADEALAALHRLLEEGEASHRLLAMVAWQLRTVLRVQELQRRGLPDARIQSELNLRGPSYARIRRLLGGGFPGAAQVMSRLARANRDMNRMRGGDQRVLESLVVELSSP